jgi:Inner membrane component of T3SS, cytoplasmic domain
MTIQAQLPHSPARSARGDHATHGMPAGNPIHADGFALLDHLIPLDRPIIHIGRGLTADVRLEDLRVSRRHAIIAQRGDGTRVLDDRSHNGTFLNGRSVTVAYLSDGDVLRVGSVALRFIVVEPQIKPAPLLRRIPLPVRAPGGLVAGSAA